MFQNDNLFLIYFWMGSFHINLPAQNHNVFTQRNIKFNKIITFLFHPCLHTLKYMSTFVCELNWLWLHKSWNFQKICFNNIRCSLGVMINPSSGIYTSTIFICNKKKPGLRYVTFSYFQFSSLFSSLFLTQLKLIYIYWT